MAEKLYTIPVNEAFEKECECPICEMYKTLEQSAIDFTMGPSYMEDDIRMETDKLGFCSEHLKLMYKDQNRLGLALMLHTHMKKTISEVEKLSSSEKQQSSGGLFKKRETSSGIKDYVEGLSNSCYVCNRVKRIMERYIVTVFYLYRTDKAFKEKFLTSKGFCTKHYGLLYEEAREQLKGKEADEFVTNLNKLYLDNMKRVSDELEWYIDKFDYRYANEPWKNSKDALPRTMIKVKSLFE